jgi:hypothetical protein
MSKVTTKMDPTAQVNIYIPYYAFLFNVGPAKPPTPSICFFTHKEKDTASTFDECAERSTWNLTMCYKTYELLPPNKTSVIRIYPDEQFYKDKIILGVVGRPCPSGRKRFEMIEALRQIPGVEVRLTGGHLLFNQLPRFYKEIDYLVVTSDNEGGPLPVLEAMAMGKPVIAPDVGFAWDYPVLQYDGTLADLRSVVQSLVVDRNGWDKSAKQLMEVIQKCA